MVAHVPVDRIEFRPAGRPRASVIVLGLDDAPHLTGCLASLAATDPTVAYEVLVVLNAPSDLCHRHMEAVAGVRVLESDANLGFAGGCNLAAAGAAGDYLVLLNDDTVVEEGWLDALVSAADRRHDAGAVGSCLLDADGRLQEAGSVLWSDGSTTAVGRGANADEWARPRAVDYCSGNGLLVRAELWSKVGGLDEGYFPAYCEDVDLCLQLEHLGLEIWYEPQARLRHLEHGSLSTGYAWFLTLRNRKRLASRWPEALARRPPPPAEADALSAAVVRARAEASTIDSDDGAVSLFTHPGTARGHDEPRKVGPPIGDGRRAHVAAERALLAAYTADLEHHLALTRSEAAATRREADGLHRKVAELEHQADLLEQGRDRAERHVEDLRGRIAALDAAADDDRRSLADAATLMALLRADLDRRDGALAARDAEVETLRRRRSVVATAWLSARIDTNPHLARARRAVERRPPSPPR